MHTLDEVAHGRGHELYACDCLGVLHARGANRTNSAYGLGWDFIHMAEKSKYLKPAASQARQVIV